MKRLTKRLGQGLMFTAAAAAAAAAMAAGCGDEGPDDPPPPPGACEAGVDLDHNARVDEHDCALAASGAAMRLLCADEDQWMNNDGCKATAVSTIDFATWPHVVTALSLGDQLVAVVDDRDGNQALIIDHDGDRRFAADDVVALTWDVEAMRIFAASVHDGHLLIGATRDRSYRVWIDRDDDLVASPDEVTTADLPLGFDARSVTAAGNGLAYEASTIDGPRTHVWTDRDANRRLDVGEDIDVGSGQLWSFAGGAVRFVDDGMIRTWRDADGDGQVGEAELAAAPLPPGCDPASAMASDGDRLACLSEDRGALLVFGARASFELAIPANLAAGRLRFGVLTDADDETTRSFVSIDAGAGGSLTWLDLDQDGLARSDELVDDLGVFIGDAAHGYAWLRTEPTLDRAVVHLTQERWLSSAATRFLGEACTYRGAECAGGLECTRSRWGDACAEPLE